jgi:hypothetical protein
MNPSELPVAEVPALDKLVETKPVAEVTQTETALPTTDPVRAAAGRLGAKRRNELVALGRKYEQEHALTPGRQRIRQLIQLGKRYEQEHGLRRAKPRRKSRGDKWSQFLTALAEVVKPAYRPAVTRLVAALAETSVAPRAA